MMIATSTTNGIVTIALTGRLDSVTQANLASELETIFKTSFTALVFDLSALEYISSAGLRVLLMAHKQVKSLGASMKIEGANPSVKELFEMIKFNINE